MTVRLRKWTDKNGRRKSSWVVDFYYTKPDGTRAREERASPEQTKQGAEAFEARLLLELSGVRPRGMTLAAFYPRVRAYAANNNKPSEVRNKQYLFESILLPAMGGLELSEVTAERIEAFKASQLLARYSKKSVNNQLIALGKALALAHEYGYTAGVPKVRKMRGEKPAFDFLTEAESARLISVSLPAWRPMITLALKTGLRVGELLALRWSDIETNEVLTVRRSTWNGQIGLPKSGREREVPLSPLARRALLDQPKMGPLVFCQPSGRPFSFDAVDQVVPVACQAASIRRATWHVLRHTFASQLVAKGVALKAVQELLGHADITTTMRYAHLSPELKRSAVDVLG